MSDVSRRSFLIGSGVGAVGVAAIGATGGLPGLAGGAASAATPEDLARAASRPMMLHVRDARRGEIGILVGEQEVVVNDRALVAKLLRATR